MQTETNDAIVEAARETLASMNGAVPEGIGLAFPDPDARNWPADVSFLSAAVGEQIPIKALRHRQRFRAG